MDPKYTITDKLLSTIVKLENIKTRMEVRDIPYNLKTKLELSSKAGNIFHMAHLLGIDLTLKDAEKLAEGRKLQSDQETHKLVNFRNVLEYNRANVLSNYADIEPALILHLNKIVITDWRETWDSKFRSVEEDKDEEYGAWTELLDDKYKEIDVLGEVSELLDWFKINSPIVHPLIRIGAVLYRLIEIKPFTAGNVMTILAIADLLLHNYGFVSQTMLPITKTFQVHEDQLLYAIRMSKKNHDITFWLEQLTEKIYADVKEINDSVEKVITEEEEKSKNQPFLDLNKRQLKALKYLQSIPTVKREDYCQMMDVSTMTAFRDLNDLVSKKLLKVEGRGRGTKYKLYSS